MSSEFFSCDTHSRGQASPSGAGQAIAALGRSEYFLDPGADGRDGGVDAAPVGQTGVDHRLAFIDAPAHGGDDAVGGDHRRRARFDGPASLRPLIQPTHVGRGRHRVWAGSGFAGLES